MRKLSESIWSDIQDRSTGDVTRREDDVQFMDATTFCEYCKKRYTITDCGKGVDYTKKDEWEKVEIPGIYTKGAFLFFYLVFHSNGEKTIPIAEGDLKKMPEIKKRLEQEFTLKSNHNHWVCEVFPKDGSEVTNQFFIDFVDFCLDNFNSPDIKKFASRTKGVNESIWSDIQDRSSGENIRKEDAIIDNETLKSKIKQLYIEQGEGDTLDVTSLSKYRFDNLSRAFDSFSKVKHIIGLEKWDVSGVTKMFYTFAFCRSLKELNISNWDVSNVTDMFGLFKECNDIIHLDLSNWDVSNVTNMSYMFHGCVYLRNLNISTWDVSKVTTMLQMFNGCWALPELDISNWDVSNVTRMEDMFRGCSHLEKLNIDNWDVSKVTNMNKDMFTNLIEKPKWYKI